MNDPEISIESLVREIRSHARADDLSFARRVAEACAAIAQRAYEAGEDPALAIRSIFML